MLGGGVKIDGLPSCRSICVDCLHKIPRFHVSVLVAKIVIYVLCCGDDVAGNANYSEPICARDAIVRQRVDHVSICAFHDKQISAAQARVVAASIFVEALMRDDPNDVQRVRRLPDLDLSLVLVRVDHELECYELPTDHVSRIDHYTGVAVVYDSTHLQAVPS